LQNKALRTLVCTTAFATVLAGAAPTLANDFVYRYKMEGVTGVTDPTPPVVTPPSNGDDTKADDGNGGLIITVTDLTPDDYYWDNLISETKEIVDQAIVKEGRSPDDVDPEYTVEGSVPGIGFNSFTGVVSGQPTAPGTYTLIVHAWDPDPDADGDDDQPWTKLVDITYKIEVTPNLSPIKKLMTVTSATSFTPSAYTTTYYDPGTPYANSAGAFVGGFNVPDADAAACATIDWSWTSSVPRALGLTTLSKSVIRMDGDPDYGYFDGGYANAQFWYYPVKVNAVCKDSSGSTLWNHRSPKFLLRVLAPA
jgi:hypothetical protein